MTKTEDAVAKQLGEMMLMVIKQRSTIEQLAAQVQSQAAEIETLRRTSPQEASKESANGHAKGGTELAEACP